MFTKIASVFVAGLALASAYTTPTTGPLGNPIYTPNLGDIVPVGAPYKITWGPTTTGTVTLLLLKGPSTNVLPLYPIAEKIANTGSFTWTPAADLAPGTTGYGLQIIDDATGQYQYSTQFGISNAAGGSVSGSATGSATGTSTLVAPTSYTAPSNLTITATSSTLLTSSTAASNATITISTSAAASTTVVGPSMTSATAPGATQSNVAGQLAASFGGVIAIMAAVAAF